MKNLDSKELALDYIMRFTGQFYKWGGDDPSGFDCSGLAIEFLKASGLLQRKFDTTARGLFNLYKKNKIQKPVRGALVFWHDGKDNIIHVEIMLNHELSIGASGGGSKTLTVQDAIDHNAFIKVRSIYTRSNIYGFVDPFMTDDITWA